MVAISKYSVLGLKGTLSTSVTLRATVVVVFDVP